MVVCRAFVHVHIDLNADVGEGAPDDDALMEVVTSVSVACGAHAGDAETMRRILSSARRHGVAVGAHPGFADREGFGRRTVHATPGEVEALIVAQLTTLADIAASLGVQLQHVKPHGALYNAAAQDAALADAIARATAAVDAGLTLVGLAGSALLEAGNRAGLHTVSEAFADRAYRADGSLLPRSEPGAVLDDPNLVIARAVAMVCNRIVIAVDGARVPLQADTICVHGDTPGAAELARQIRDALEAAGVALAPLGRQHPP